MFIRFTRSYQAGNGRLYRAGEVLDVERRWGNQLIADGAAIFNASGDAPVAVWNAQKTSLSHPDTGNDVTLGGAGLATGRTITVGVAAVLTDAGTIIQANSASAIVVTIPNDSTVAWAADSVIAVYQVGAGVASFAAGSGVTLRVPTSYAASVQYDTIFARRVGANEWVVSK